MSSAPVAPEAPARSARAFWWRALASLLALGAVLWLVDVRKVASSFALDARYALAALLVALLQFLLLAARWRSIARALGLPLAYRTALAEYFLSALVNQLVPSGIAGDALRAARHAQQVTRDSGQREHARAVLALLLDRASGQVALWAFALATLPSWWPVIASRSELAPALLGALSLVLAGAAIGAFLLVRARWGHLRELSTDALRVLFGPRTAALHLPLSALLVVLHVAVFQLCALALGTPLELGAAFGIVPALLLVATLPAFFAGFGAREAAAAGLYGLLGLPALDGAKVSLVFGFVGILASTPGIYSLWRHR